MRANVPRARQIASAVISQRWLVQDSTGQYISSGVLNPFPTSLRSDNCRAIVPGASATGQDAIGFGFAHASEVGAVGPFRLAYVTVARRP